MVGCPEEAIYLPRHYSGTACEITVVQCVPLIVLAQKFEVSHPKVDPSFKGRFRLSLSKLTEMEVNIQQILWSTYRRPGTVLGARDTMMTKQNR